MSTIQLERVSASFFIEFRRVLERQGRIYLAINTNRKREIHLCQIYFVEE